MSVEQTRRLLTLDLPELPVSIVDHLIAETGRWPLLVRLINKILVDQTRLRTDIVNVAEELAGWLRRHGLLQVDQLSVGHAADRTRPPATTA